MPDQNGKLYLYEAIELRAEYDARIKTLKACLPESRHNRERTMWGRENDERERPNREMDPKEIRKDLATLEFKRRKLNGAIQKANCGEELVFENERMTLGEALEARKTLNERIGELHSRAGSAAFSRVIYKEDRDIVEENPTSFSESLDQLDKARTQFRMLNRGIRRASFEAAVEYRDEQ